MEGNFPVSDLDLLTIRTKGEAMYLRLAGGRIRQGAVDVGKNTGFIVEQKTAWGWDQVQIPNAAARRWARFILKRLGRKNGAR